MKCSQIEEVIILFTLIQKKIEGHTKSLSLTCKETTKKKKRLCNNYRIDTAMKENYM